MPRVDLGNGYLADFPDDMSKDDIQAALRKQFGQPRASDQPVPETRESQPLSKGVQSNGMLPGHEGTLDRSKAGDNWTTAEISEDGIPKHYILPTQPGDKPPSGDGIEMGDAVKRFQQTGQHYGAFDSDETASNFMKGAASPTGPAGNDPEAKSSLLGDAVDTAYSTISGVGQGAFGVGDYAGAAGQLLGAAIRGQPIGPREAYARAKALREASQARHPIAAAAGTVAGAVATAPAFSGAVRQIPGIARALAPVAGQTVRNVARVAAEGGAASGVAAAAEGEDPITAGAEGAVISPAAAKAAQAGLAAGKKVVGLISSQMANANAMTALAKRIGSTPDELRTAMDSFRAATGRPPTLAEIVDSGSAAELGKIAEARKVAGDRFNQSAEDITAARPAQMQRQIASRGPTDTQSNLVGVRDNAMNAAMSRVGNVVVRVPPRDVDRFLDPDAARVLSRDLRARLSQAQISGRPAQLTVRDLDNMRLAFGDAAGTGQRYVFNDLADRAAHIGSVQVPAYGSALSEYSAFSRGIKGFEHGSKGTLPSDLKTAGDIADAQTAEYNAGRNVGVRSRIAEAAGASERGAVSSANDLRQNAGTAGELRGALGARETTRLQAQGAAETQGARNLSQIAPGAQAPSDEAVRDVRTAVENAAAAGGKTLTGYKAHVLSRLLTSVSVSRDTARRIAEASTDPQRLPGVIDALRRARLNDAQIREIFLPRAAVAAGTLTGDEQ